MKCWDTSYVELVPRKLSGEHPDEEDAAIIVRPGYNDILWTVPLQLKWVSLSTRSPELYWDEVRRRCNAIRSSGSWVMFKKNYNPSPIITFYRKFGTSWTQSKIFWHVITRLFFSSSIKHLQHRFSIHFFRSQVFGHHFVNSSFWQTRLFNYRPHTRSAIRVQMIFHFLPSFRRFWSLKSVLSVNCPPLLVPLIGSWRHPYKHFYGFHSRFYRSQLHRLTLLR